jgi:hypothetical protein
MKHVTRLILFIFLAFTVALALPNSVQAADAADDKVVFGDTYTLASGQTLNGNLAVLGGTATLEAGSTVNGDVALMGGTLEISGTVSGNVSTLGGTLFLDDGAVIEKDVSMMGGTLHRSENAQIRGSLVNGGFRPFQFNLPNLPINWSFSNGFPWTPIWNFFSTLFSTLVVAALAVLVVLLWPHPTERVARAVVAQPAVTGGLGLLTVIVLPAMLILLMITIILIPFSLLGLLVLGLALLFGWIAVGLEIGNRIAGLFKQQWNPALTAGLGTLVIGLIASGVGWIPCVGWLVPFIAAMVGLGGVVVTRFGTQLYPSTLSPAPAYAALAAPAVSYAPQAIVPPVIIPQGGPSQGEAAPGEVLHDEGTIVPPAEPTAPGEDQNPTI